ncbi:MAG: hypothetical protein L6365_05655 [Desulfobulbaceae bacterium]|nr:hypothetical protein [Pseudomonadota bacterium]MCG2746998.1 hypothetical protein [Desulfobulbaceae bacterium]
MANFLNRRQFTTKKAQITVESGLPVGKHLFQVTAVHEDGTRSQPVEVIVSIGTPVLRDPIMRETAEEPASGASSSTTAAARPNTSRPSTKKTKKTRRAGRKQKP